MSDTSKQPLVCIIDDAIDLMSHIKDFLNFSGFDVQTASNGEEGLAIIRSSNPQVVIVDMRMPGMDGIEVIKIAREEGYAGHVIVATGLSDDSDRQRCLNIGANDFLLKPYGMADLEKRIRAQTGN